MIGQSSQTLAAHPDQISKHCEPQRYTSEKKAWVCGAGMIIT